MPDIEYKCCGENKAGERLYQLWIGGKIVSSEPVTIDEVMRQISRADEEDLGRRHMQLPEDNLPRHSRR